ncbi:MAG: hypothetical protein JSR41_03680 [Proteobacteria bacterium]|nr:hypothetical protein [Pseudomonadota bacterium]
MSNNIGRHDGGSPGAMRLADELVERARKVDIYELVSQRYGVTLKKQGAEYVGLCPLHEEKTPSFSVNREKNVFRCHGCGRGGDAIKFIRERAGCDFKSAVELLVGAGNSIESLPARADRPMAPDGDWEQVNPVPADAPAPPAQMRHDGRSIDIQLRYAYRNAAGALVHYVCRADLLDGGKVVRPLIFMRNRRSGALAWKFQAMRAVRPLYGLDLLAVQPDSQVLIVEGEKATEAARRLIARVYGARPELPVVVTFSGGANAIRKANLESLRGRVVIVWGDADEPGQKAADLLCSLLHGVAAQVKRLDPPEGKNSGWDAADAEADSTFDLKQFAKTARIVTFTAPTPLQGAGCVGATSAQVGALSGDETGVATRNRSDVAVAVGRVIEAIENSDDALALHFVDRAANFRWSPGLGWMVDDGVVWARDDALHRFDLARRVCRAVAATCGPKSDSDAKRISSAKTVHATLVLAQADRNMVVPTNLWDADPLLLNTPNGVVDLRTGNLRARGIEFVTQATAVGPDFTASCPIWLRFLEQVFLGDAQMIEFMQRSMGYWITGSVSEQVLHFLHGQGSNGKSVLSDLVKWITGSYGIKLAATALMQAKGERHPTELAQLRGKRLALSSELAENDFFNDALLKELTGDATLSARFMRGDFFEFPMTQKHVIVGNFKPRLRGGDPAIARRMLLVPFNATFTGSAKDKFLLDKLKAEGPAILAWMVRGAEKWSKEGLAVPASVQAASASYMAAMDDLRLWMSEACEMKGESRAKDLYASFSSWKKARGEHPPSQTVWGERMKVQPGIGSRVSNGVKYTGIRLNVAEANLLNIPLANSQFTAYEGVRG